MSLRRQLFLVLSALLLLILGLTLWASLAQLQPQLDPDSIRSLSARMALIFGVIYLAALFVIAKLLGYFLEPLGWIEQSARAAQQKRFEQITAQPRSPELARVVQAMNDMSRRMGEILDEGTTRAEKLRRHAYQDELTGFANHKGFELLFKQLLDDDPRFDMAGMLLLELDGMQPFYRQHGYRETSPFMTAVAQIAQDTFKTTPRALLARQSEAAFSFVIPNKDEASLTKAAETLRTRLLEAIAQCPAKDHVSFSLGLSFFKQDDKPSDILARADLALETARHQGLNGLHVQTRQEDQASALGSFGWRTLIKNALAENRWQLVAQPVVELEERQLVHDELMARLVDTNGQLVPATQFLPMAARHELMTDVDIGLVTLAIKRLRAGKGTGRIAINLSPQSVASSDFFEWLDRKLAELKPEDAARLSVEVSEYGCLSHPDAARQVLEVAHEYGARFGIDNFGVDPRALQLLRQLPPDYVKLNGGLVEALPKDMTAQILVEAIVDLAHSLEAPVIAQNVESEDQVRALKNVSVDGGQGYLFGAPA